MKERSILLANALSGRDNNLNLIRFVAATMVLVAHSFTIVTGDASLEPFSSSINKSIGSVAVDIFFIISGMLITGSLVQNPNYTRYAISRIIRILPALFVANILTVLVLGPLFTGYTLIEYILEISWLKYLIKNGSLLLGVQYQLSDLFASAPYPGVVNGSLWTLPYELKMYFLVALLFSVCSFLNINEREKTFRSCVSVVVLLSLAYLIAGIILQDSIIPYWKGGRLVYMFFLGALFFLWRDKIVLSGKLFVISLTAVALSFNSHELFLSAYLIFLPYIVIFLAYVPKGRVRRFNQIGDFSYGIYIYAFPIQQALISTWQDMSVLAMVLGAFSITLLLSVLSWYFVEKPSLSKRNVIYEVVTNRVFKSSAASY
ncbi:acyltransferase [Microbulbifer sp. ALW1]|uniref:acyltransferase family protein n=1 Tax=Microbulbifer sp. (strain ALW1) TaxID=1516059 RepID=UPI00135B28EE|nr:acyltransferase [Microbulbifer sp. ALW1]